MTDTKKRGVHPIVTDGPPDSPQVHELKLWPRFFPAVALGAMEFQLRRNDRGYGRGDFLILREWDPEKLAFTGNVTACEVSIVYRPDDLPAGMMRDGDVLMGIKRLVPKS